MIDTFARLLCFSSFPLCFGSDSVSLRSKTCFYSFRYDMKDSITVLIASSILGKARSFTPQAIHRTLRLKCFIERTCFCSIKQMLKFILFATFFVCLSASCMPVEGPDDILINQPHYLCMTINGKERTVFYPKVDQYGRYSYKGCTCRFLCLLTL